MLLWFKDLMNVAGNLVLSTNWKRKLATVKGTNADVSSVSPSSGQLEELCKTLEQKFIFQMVTLNPHGINERFSFN